MAAGYTLLDSLRYTWLTQGLLAFIYIWGWWDIANSIRTGQVASDLAKPFDYYVFWLSQDLGRAVYHFVFRAIPTYPIGMVLFGIGLPGDPIVWLGFARVPGRAALVSFAFRFSDQPHRLLVARLPRAHDARQHLHDLLLRPPHPDRVLPRLAPADRRAAAVPGDDLRPDRRVPRQGRRRSPCSCHRPADPLVRPARCPRPRAPRAGDAPARRAGRLSGGCATTSSVYLHLCAADVRSQMQYRVSYLLLASGTFVSLFLEFVTIVIFFQRFPTLGGWSIGEVAFIYGLASMAFGLAEMISGGFDHFSSLILRGDFDRLLVRPVSPFAQVFSQEFQLRRFARISQGIVVFLIGLGLLDAPVWTLGKLAYLALSLVSGAAVYVGLFIIGATLCFWTIQTTEIVNIFTHGGTEMVQYPMTIYPDWFRRFFIFVIPLAFVTYYPALYMLGRSDDLGLPPGSPTSLRSRRSFPGRRPSDLGLRRPTLPEHRELSQWQSSRSPT